MTWAGPLKGEKIGKVGHVWKSGQDECVGQKDKMALGPPGQRRVGGKEAGLRHVPENLKQPF